MVPSTNAPPARRVVVVLGMHRSGTSLVAGCLQRLGVDFGPRLMPPNPDNPRGYFEHRDVVNLHDRLLLALDRSWDETNPFPPHWWRDRCLAVYRAPLLSLLRRDFPDAPLWGLKDPRLCRLLPWWEDVWPELASRPLFLLVRRSPADVAASLARREGMSAAKAHLLWLQHILEAEHLSRSHERILVDFGDFLADENAALAPTRKALGLCLARSAELPTLVDPALGRSAISTDAQGWSAWAEEADAALCLGLAGRAREMQDSLDELSRRMQAPEALPASAAASREDLMRQVEMTRRQARWYEAEWRKAQARADVLQTRSVIKKDGVDQKRARNSHG